jgi:predicted ATPase
MAVAGPSVVLVAGDAGVGLSRLIEKLAIRIRAGGVRVRIGGCIDCGHVGAPFAPVTKLPGDLAGQLGPASSEATSDLPDGGLLLAGVATVSDDATV